MLKEFKEFMVMGASPSLKNNNNSPHPMLTGKGDNKKKKGRNQSNHGSSPTIFPLSTMSVKSPTKLMDIQCVVKTAEKLHRASIFSKISTVT